MISNLNKLTENEKEQSNCSVYESVRFGILLAIVGGFLDAYTYIGRGNVLANAQTGNIVLLGVNLAAGNWKQAIFHIPPILAFVLGVIVSEKIKSNTSQYFINKWPQIILIFEIIVFLIIGFIPSTVPNFIVNVTISFIASVQVCSFRKLVDSNYSTTMSTGNLRIATQAIYKAFTENDYHAELIAHRYFTIILSFIFGGFLGGFLTLSFGVKSIWAANLFLMVATVMVSEENNGLVSYAE